MNLMLEEFIRRSQRELLADFSQTPDGFHFLFPDDKNISSYRDFFTNCFIILWYSQTSSDRSFSGDCKIDNFLSSCRMPAIITFYLFPFSMEIFEIIWNWDFVVLCCVKMLGLGCGEEQTKRHLRLMNLLWCYYLIFSLPNMLILSNNMRLTSVKNLINSVEIFHCWKFLIVKNDLKFSLTSSSFPNFDEKFVEIGISWKCFTKNVQKNYIEAWNLETVKVFFKIIIFLCSSV